MIKLKNKCFNFLKIALKHKNLNKKIYVIICLKALKIYKNKSKKISRKPTHHIVCFCKPKN